MLRWTAIAALLLACRPTPSSTVPPPGESAPRPGVLADAAVGPPSEPDDPRPVVESADERFGGDDIDETPLPPLPTGTAAQVGSVKIAMADFHAIYDLKVDKYLKRGRAVPPTADARYRRSIAERLIYHEVLRQEATALGVTIDQAELAARQAQQSRGIRDWTLHLERRGETDASLREMFIAELREQAILKKLGKLEVTRAEIQAEYEKIKDDWRSDQPRVRASHVFIGRGEPPPQPGDPPLPPGSRSPAEAEAKARQVHALAKKKGADFAALAREHGEGPSAAKGGDVGIFTADRMAEEFSAAALKMKVGQISKPVKTKFGWHIIKVTGRWPPGVLPLSALEEDITARLQQRKLHEGRRVLKEDLLRRYAIVDHVAPTLRR